jgi:hypothetical protein
MTKGADGAWSITIGPLPPEIWIYNFRIEGVDLPDPANISQMPRAAGTAISSFVEVPGDGTAFYDARPVPHGDVRMVLYESKAMGVNRYLWVYTPPHYDTSRQRYPVYYLLHGNGETQSGWVANGRANVILDNLIAEGKAAPMIVVMPHGHPIQSASVGPPVVVPPYGGDPGMLNLLPIEYTVTRPTGFEMVNVPVALGSPRCLRRRTMRFFFVRWLTRTSAYVRRKSLRRVYPTSGLNCSPTMLGVWNQVVRYHVTHRMNFAIRPFGPTAQPLTKMCGTLAALNASAICGNWTALLRSRR